MKKKFISLLLAFLMLVTTLPVPALAQEVGPASEELEKLDYEFERIDGQDYLKVTLPANSVEVVEDPYVIRPMSIKDNVPTQGGAGHFINWGTGVVWNVYDKNDPNKLAPFPPTGKKPYEVKLTKELNGKNVVIGKVTVSTATEFEDDIKPDKPTTYQFVTTENYEVGDENKELSAEFPIELEMNLLYEVAQTSAKGPIGNNHEYNLIFLIVTRLTSPTYTAEWDTTTGALKPTVKGKIVTGKNNKAIIDVFNDDGKYGTICNKPAKTYIDEEDKDGNLIGEIRYTKKGSLDIKSVLWTKGSIPVMSGQFLSYSTKNIDEDGNVTTIDHNINGTKGLIPAHYATMNDGAGKKYTPPYFYNLVGDNDHMWRFQLKEGLEVKFNTGVGSETEGGLAGQDIGQASTIAYGEKFDSNLKGAFSEKTISLPTANPVAPTLNKNNVNLTFKGWKLVQGLEVPVNPQKIEKDGEGKETLTDVTPDYATTDALKAALSDSNFKGFTGKNPVFYAIFGQTQGKANIQYVDDQGTDLLKDEFKIQGQDYKTEKLGELNEAVTATTDEAPQFKGYAINKVEIEPITDAKYVDPATATIKFVYKVKATTDDKSSDQDYIKVTFDANDGHFGTTTTDKTKDVWVYSGKASFADAKEKVDSPTKDNADFKEWQTAKTDGKKVEDIYTLSKADEKFYANYTTKAQGKASVEYIDVKTGKAIQEKYRAEDATKYPAEKEGKQGEKIATDVYTKDSAPKFVGYEFNRVEISPKDGAYALPGTSVIKVYYNKLDDIIPDDTPDTDEDKPDGYVTVKFLADDATHAGDKARGTLEGETKFYVNPKAEKKNSDLTEPIIKAKTGFTVKEKDEKWSPKFDKTSTEFITADATYTAQYTDGEDVIPVPDPSNPPDKPAGYVTVTFDLDGKGTTTDTRVFFVNPNKEVTLTPPTVTGINNYEQKTGDDAWSPKFVTKAKYDKDTTFVAQYNFTKDVVPQGPGEDKPVVPDNYVKVTFKEGDYGVISASQTTIFWVNPDKEVTLTAPVVTANAEYKHTAWKYNVNNQDKITSGTDATKTVKDTFAADTDITAQYKKKVVDTEPKEPGTDKPDPDYVKVTFKAEIHGDLGKDSQNKPINEKSVWVLKDETVEITTPAVEPDENYAFEKWNPAVQTSYSEDKTHNAVFKYTGDDVVPQKPDEDKPDVPKDFVQVVFAEGDQGTIAADATTTFWVNPEKEVTVTAPAVTANDDYKHVAWTYGTKEVKTLESVTDKFTEKKTTITAKYLKKVLEEEPQTDKDAYVKVTFKAETNGKLADDKTEKSYWVLKDTPVDITPPTVTANAGWKFIKFEPVVKDSYSEETVHNAQYKKIIVTEDPKDKDYVKVTFDPAEQGTIKAGSNAEVWVIKEETIDPKDITPELDIKEGYALEKWDLPVKTSYSEDTKHTAIYKYNGDDVVPQKPGEDKPNVPDNFVKVTFVAGEHGSIANTETYIFWVNPEKQVTLNAPTVTAKEDYKHVAWTYGKKEVTNLKSVTDTFASETTITAKYLEKVVTEDPNDKENYVKVDFKADSDDQTPVRGSLEGTTTYWVLKNTDVKVDAPKVTPNSGYTFTEWSPAVKTKYDADTTTHTAQYKEKDKVVTEDPDDKDYIKVIFDANGGTFGTETTKDLWVLKGIAKFADAKERVATPTKEKATFKEWQDADKNGKAVADDKTLSTDNETFYAVYTDDAKIIEDPTTPQPNPGYVRLTFDATTDGKIEGKQIKLIDVLQGTKYNDTDLQNKIKTVIAVYKDNTKIFDNWNPEFPNKAEDVATSSYTATYKVNTKIIDKDPDTPGTIDDGYIRFIFDANTTDNPAITGKIGKNQKVIFDVIKGTKFNDTDLQTKINGIKAVADDAKLKFNAWDPTVLNDDTLVENATTGMSDDKTTITYNATYTDKDKIIDVTPGTEDEDPDNAYVRFIFNAVGTDKENTTVNGTVKGNAKYAFDVLKGTKFNDPDLQTKINSLKAVAKDYKFVKWTPDVLNDDTLVEAGNVTKHEYTATYEKLEKIIDVTDPTVDPDEDYVRLTFKSGEGTFGKDAKNQDIKEIAIDVLKETSYTDQDLQNKVKEIEGKAKANDENKKFNAWNPQVPATGLVETQDFTAQYVDKDKIIDDPTTPQPEDGYVRLTFDATKDGKINGKQTKVIDVLDTLKYSDKDLQDKIESIKAIPNNTTKKFNAWTPAVPADDTAVTEETYTANYVDKDKIIDVTPGTEDEDPDNAYVRFIFNAVGTDKENTTVNGTVKGNAKYAFDVLKGTKFNDPDLQTKINSLKAVAKDYKFVKWTPDVLNDDTLVEAGNVTKHEYTATYEKLEKIIDVTDPTVDPDEDYVRLTFKSGEGTFGKDAKNQDIKEIAIDVLKETSYTDQDLQNKVKEIEGKAKANDENKKFNAWNPQVPATGLVETQDFTAQYVDKDKIIDDPTTPQPEDGYVRLTFDATKDGKINGKQTKVIDVLDTLKYSDKDLQDKIESIKAIPNNTTKKFNAWTPAVPADDTAVTEETYTANYVDKDKIIDVTPGTEDEDPDNAYVRFIFNAVGTDKENTTVNGTVKGNAKYAFDVLKGTKFNDPDLQTKINSLKAVAKDYKFVKWTPDVLNDDTLVEAGNVTKHEYTATYEKLEKIIDVTDPTVDPDEYHVRLTFDATKDGKIGDVNGQQTKAIDVLKGTPYTDKELIDKIASIKAIPVKNDNGTTVEDTDKKFNAWSPLVPTTGYVNTETFKASYKTKTPGQESIDISATKTWQDADGQAPKFTTPEVKFELWRKAGQAGTEEIVKVATELTNNSVTFSGVDKYDANNVEYTYFVKEVFTNAAEKDNWIVNGAGTLNLTNKLKGDPTNPDQPNPDTDKVATLTITKKLENEPVIKTQSNGMRRAPKQALKFSFKVTGPYGYEETFELAANESKTLENLAYGDYIVEETDAKGYTPEYSKAKETLTKDSPNGSITVTNKNKESTDPQNPNTNIIDVTVKKVWANVPQGTNTPQVKIELWRKGYDLSNKEYEQKVGEFTTAADNTSNKETNVFKDLAKHDPSGRDFTYYAVESNVPENYKATYSTDKLTVTNNYEAPPTPAKEYTVTYAKGADAATGTMNPATVTENTDHTVLANGFTNEGFTFKGWKVGDTTTIVQPGATINVTGNVTLTAQWEKTPIPPTPAKEYTVTYAKGADAATGTMNPVTVTENTDHTVLANGFTNEGFTFTGWKVGDTTTIVQPGATINVTGNVTLTAQWEKTQIPPTPGTDPTDFTINYYSADSSMGYVSPTSETVEITGGTIDGSTATAYSGYRFVRWTRNGIQVSTDAKFVPTAREAATYIAVFEKVGSVIPPTPSDTFTIHYVARYDDMGWVSRDYEVVENPYGEIMGSTAIARNGYRFVKWVDEYGDTVSRYERFVPYERREATYFAIFERDYPYDPYYPDHRPDDRPNRPDDRYDRDDRDDDTVRKPEDTRPVLDHEAYMFGYTDGTVRPNGNITRAEAAALVTRLLGIEAYASAAKPNFPDTPSAWYNKAINAAVERGIMKGYPDGRFRPNAPITRAEFTQMISTIDNKPYGVAPFADVVGHWAERPIGSEYQAGRITGYPDGLFRPNAYITRCEAVVILNKIFERKYDELSPINAINAERIKRFIDLTTSFWGYNDMVEATNSHSFKRRVQGRIEEDWVLVK